MKYDLHTHSKYSRDGWIDVEKMVKIAIKKGLSGIALTDHNTIKGALKAKKLESEKFKVIIGSEISTERGEVIGLFLSEEIRSRRFEEVISQIQDQDGIIVLPHPFDNIRGNGINPNHEDAKLVDYVEIFNSRCLLNKYNIQAEKYAEKYGLHGLAGSDAHFAHEIGNAGVYIQEDDLRKGFEKGDLKTFGRKTSPLNLGLTKGVKILKKNQFW
ncbi:PHP domain-containing protein [uncultured Methanobacterium sp.]|uniref:PHP domain-containing protein n=1 Tax=uncultured Methanobacterium sp. TaxID=176306 RepID=UPI002AA78E23|nr:PHP domain-containing protein [uncultured Methanobacterium sp.]